MYGSPGQEEDDADHHKDEVCSPPPCQLPQLSPTTNCILCNGGPWSHGVGDSEKKLVYHLLLQQTVLLDKSELARSTQTK